ncbi:MAG: alpha/beta hydrolase family protein [Armatimonadaceae bacterium]
MEYLSPSEYHLMRADQIVPELRFAGGDVTKWQSQLRPRLAALTGWDQWNERSQAPLTVETLWKRTVPHGTICKVRFLAEPGSYVVGYLCLPDGAEEGPPRPAAICMQGHNSGAYLSVSLDREEETRTIPTKNDQDFGLQCLRNGYVGFCLEMRSFGHRREQRQEKTHKSHCLDAALHALLLGWTLMAERVFDVERTLGYLQTLPFVDPERIGVLGESGGGTVSLYAAALLPELAFAVVACGFCSFREGIMQIPHCSDNYIPGLYRVAEMADIAGLIAPRALVLVAGTPDDFYPLPAVTTAAADVSRIYSAIGAENRCIFTVGEDGHRFYADLAWSSLRTLFPSRTEVAEMLKAQET